MTDPREPLDWTQVDEQQLADTGEDRRRPQRGTAAAFNRHYRAAKPRPVVSLVPLVVVLAAVVVLGALLPRWLNGPSLGINRPDGSSPSAPVEPASPQPSAQASGGGTDTSAEDAPAPAEPQALEAAAVFCRAWVTREPQARRAGLDTSAIPSLRDALMDTLPAKIWPTQPRGEAEVLRSTAYRVEARQWFNNGRALVLVLERRPESPHGWLVTSIAEGKS